MFEQHTPFWEDQKSVPEGTRTDAPRNVVVSSPDLYPVMSKVPETIVQKVQRSSYCLDLAPSDF